MVEPTLLQPMGLVELYLRSYRIYLRTLPTLLLLGIILWIPALITLGIGAVSMVWMGNTVGIVFYLFGLLASYAFMFYFYAGATLAVSLNIIGLKASVSQILRRIRGKIGIQLLGTGLLQTLIIYAGMILLVIPGIIWSVRYLFAQPIVVLESTAYRGALRRSRELTEGYWWRLFGSFWVAIVGFIITWLIFGVILYIPLLLLGAGGSLGMEFAILAFYPAMPVLFIYPVLLYYDLRVRKEAFGVETIREAV